MERKMEKEKASKSSQRMDQMNRSAISNKTYFVVHSQWNVVVGSVICSGSDAHRVRHTMKMEI